MTESQRDRLAAVLWRDRDRLAAVGIDTTGVVDAVDAEVARFARERPELPVALLDLSGSSWLAACAHVLRGRGVDPVVVDAVLASAGPWPPAGVPGRGREETVVVEVCGEIDDESARWFAATVDGLDAGRVIVAIASGGGLVSAAADMMAAMARFPGRVDTHVAGFAGSAAALLLVAGDYRTAAPGAAVMLHPAHVGESADVDPAVGSLAALAATDGMVAWLAHRLGDAPGVWARIGRGEVWWSAERARADGLVNAVHDPTAGARRIRAGAPVQPSAARRNTAAVTVEVEARRRAWVEQAKARALGVRGVGSVGDVAGAAAVSAAIAKRLSPRPDRRPGRDRPSGAWSTLDRGKLPPRRGVLDGGGRRG